MPRVRRAAGVDGPRVARRPGDRRSTTRWGEAFKELTLHKFFEEGGVLSPEKMHMFFTACYDLDKFREFVFGSTLLERFEVDEDFVEEMRYDDEGTAALRLPVAAVQSLRRADDEVASRGRRGVQGRLDKQELFAKAARAVQEETMSAKRQARERSS